MKGICCICRKSIGVVRVESRRVVTSFALSHFGLCPACFGRTRADISRIYGQGGTGANPAGNNPAAAEKGIAA